MNDPDYQEGWKKAESWDHVAFDVDGERVTIHKVRWVIEKK